MKKLISVLMAVCLVLCLVPATVFADTAVELTEALAALEVTSQLPLEYQCELGSGQLYKKGGIELYAELLKLTANAGEKLMISFYGSEDSVDTRILVYEAESDNSLTEICDIDSNEHIEHGERYLFEVPENGVYYIALCGIDGHEQGKCDVKLEKLDGNRTTLDFSTSDAPTSDATGLWTWNKQTKTLTLKDGFKLYMSEGCTAIYLPDGATVVVEGKADLVADSNNEQYAIECEGDLTIMGSSESSVLDARYFLYTIVTYGKLTVKDIALNTDGSVNYMPYGGLEVENSRLNALATYQNIQLYEMSFARGATPQKPIIKVTDSALKMYASSNCIYYNVNNGEITFKNSFVELLSFDLQTILLTSQSLEELACDGHLTFDGGFVRAETKNTSVFLAYKISFLNNAAVDIKANPDFYLMNIVNIEGFTIPNSLNFYDTVYSLVKTGSWRSDYFTDNNDINVDDNYISRIQTVHLHSYDAWSTDSENHWHECTNKFCPDIKSSVKDKGEHTGVDDGDCTTPVLCEVCSKELTAAKAAHAFGEWVNNGDGTHTRHCTNEGCTATETKSCTGEEKCPECGGKSNKNGGGNGNGGAGGNGAALTGGQNSASGNDNAYKASPKTGDSAAQLAGITLLGAAALAAVIFGKKR